MTSLQRNHGLVRELESWRVHVDEVLYLPHAQVPEDRPHAFLYRIRIVNLGAETVTLLGRKWVVRENSGEVIVVEGDGVVGETPTLRQGETFSYHSFHVVKCSATVQGSYFGVMESRADSIEAHQGIRHIPVMTRIPDFVLQVP